MADFGERKEGERQPILETNPEPVFKSRKLKAAESRRDILELRKSGMSERAIAARMGIGASTVHKHLTKAIAEIPQRVLGELIVIETERLDTAQRAIWPEVLKGNDRVTNTYLRLSARRSIMLGMDAQPGSTNAANPPVVSGPVKLTPEEEVILKIRRAEAIAKHQQEMKGFLAMGLPPVEDVPDQS